MAARRPDCGGVNDFFQSAPRPCGWVSHAAAAAVGMIYPCPEEGGMSAALPQLSGWPPASGWTGRREGPRCSRASVERPPRGTGCSGSWPALCM